MSDNPPLSAESPTPPESNTDGGGAHSDGSGSNVSPSTDTKQTKAIKFPYRGLLIVGVLAGAAMAYARWYVAHLDYQNANMIQILAMAVVALFCLVAFHRMARSRGQRFLVPMISLGLIGASVAAFEFQGFSGEMWPQYSWRFGSDARGRWQESPLDETQAAPTDRGPETFALADSPQFLGPNRTGVVSERLFAVPTNNSDTQVLWDQPIGDGWSSFAVHQDRAVTLEQREQWECVTCYRIADGELLWIDRHEARHENPLGGVGPRSTPAISDGKVYAMGAMGLLRVLDLQTGERIWTKDFLTEAQWSAEEFLSAAPWGHASSPLVLKESNMVVVSFGGPVDPASIDDQGMTPTSKSLIALDSNTGDVKWKAGRDQFAYASPMLLTLADQPQLVSVNEKTITGHAPASGETLWSVPWPGSTSTNANCASVIPIGGDRFVIGKGYGGGSGVFQVNRSKSDEMTTEAIWTSNRVLKTKFNHTCVRDQIGYGLSNGTLQAADLRTGKPLWSQSRRERFGQGQVVLIDDVLVAQSEPGDVVFAAADADEYRELGRLEALQSKTWNIPTVAGRHLLVRNDRQAICYLLPARQMDSPQNEPPSQD
ncbi:PQQ-binding-like beta-propeller repeat protein [Stieleria marina]|uniref:outer membrane protein assembly factor BamB family protein n=1 Tax=Stieleria marina TaxID=1930275 RepID=UPI003AF3FD56